MVTTREQMPGVQVSPVLAASQARAQEGRRGGPGAALHRGMHDGPPGHPRRGDGEIWGDLGRSREI